MRTSNIQHRTSNIEVRGPDYFSPTTGCSRAPTSTSLPRRRRLLRVEQQELSREEHRHRSRRCALELDLDVEGLQLLPQPLDEDPAGATPRGRSSAP